MRRIFHPVGQGAFFSEHFEETKTPFAVVYDCGSSTLTAKQRKTKINSSFKKGEVIDMLFISHFHEDHINGIEFLKQQCDIKNVVIPYLDDEAKALIKVANYLEYKFTETEIIDNPENYFGDDSRIIRVRPVGENGAGEGANIEQPFPVDDEDSVSSASAGGGTTGGDKASKIIDSGTPIKSYHVPFWLFIPYNYEMKARSALFLSKLDEKGLSVADIDTIEKIEKHKSTLKQIYEFVTGDLNKNSLLLYSGPISLNKEVMTGAWTYDYPLFFQRLADRRLACLYTGDADLNEDKLVDTLFHSLAKLKDLIGSFVSAHHGAVKNHSTEIAGHLPNVMWHIFSYGTKNTYGHPSDQVIGDLITPGNFIVRVTEEPESLAVFKSLKK